MQINWDVAYNYIIFAAVLVLWGEFRALVSRRIYDRHQWKNHLPDEYKYNLDSRDRTIEKQKHTIEIQDDRLKHKDRSITAMIKLGISEYKE